MNESRTNVVHNGVPVSSINWKRYPSSDAWRHRNNTAPFSTAAPSGGCTTAIPSSDSVERNCEGSGSGDWRNQI